MRSPARLLVPLALICTLAGCATPTPDPTPTPTGFATEDEAFEAAEATYREYVEAENAIDLAYPSTFEPVFALTTGDANAHLREDLTTWHADGLSRVGSSSIDAIALHQADLATGLVQLDVCLDVGDIDVFNADGESLVSPDRVDVQQLRITFTHSKGETLISKSEGREGGLSCE